jgi:hypothetical protein
MLSSAEIRRQVGQRLRELFPKAKAWEETAGARVGTQTADLLVKFRLATTSRPWWLTWCRSDSRDRSALR